VSNEVLAFVIFSPVGFLTELFASISSVVGKSHSDAAALLCLPSAAQLGTVIPGLVVLLSFTTPTPMDLLVDPFILVTGGMVSLVSWMTIADARTNWFKGYMLLGLCIVIVVGSFGVRA
jgi:Ca2+/H+ antiporter